MRMATFDFASLYDAEDADDAVANRVAMRIDEVASLVDSTVRDLLQQAGQMRRERRDSSVGSRSVNAAIIFLRT
jgi:hypothetical protein